MNRPTFLRRSTALLLTLVLMICAALPGFAAYQMPIQTASDTESVYLFNLDTGKPILRQNSDQQRYIASLTKMMTALLFLESGKDMNAEITIPTSLTQEFKDIQNANGSTMNLRIGETVRRIDLLNAMLIVGQRHRQRRLGRRPDGLCGPDERPRQGAGLHGYHLLLRPRSVRLRQRLHGRGPAGRPHPRRGNAGRPYKAAYHSQCAEKEAAGALRRPLRHGGPRSGKGTL